MLQEYDLIVVGGGHAGCEAAAAAANLGSQVLLITMNMGTIADMSCNPAMGGVAKGQIVREIDALGGYSGIVTDESMIQFRMLNKSKGPAMWSPRAQCDRLKFAETWRLKLEATPNVDFWQDMVTQLIIEEDEVRGVVTSMGMHIKAKSVVLTTGTFMNGIIHLGDRSIEGGRASEPASKGLTEQLNSIGFKSGRMKTGTPPRVDGRTLNYDLMEEQPGDENPEKFSFSDTPGLLKQRSCFITYTNETTHDILRTGFEQSPMFTGRIKGVGPRYCPSIEDKIERFSERDRHQIFVEPEGWNTVEVYVNGFSTSLPEDVQLKAMRQMKGFEKAKMFRPGYAIEYDYFPPMQLNLTLETKLISNLYFAGQINGTTGYEEAGSQGLMAGINAHLKNNEKDPFILKRSEAYIGVLIDDLINKGTDEPYRMFTSRAEYRILLRQDNADIRLSPKAHKLGLIDNKRLENVEFKEAETKNLIKFCKETSILPADINSTLKKNETNEISQKTKIFNLVARPQLALKDITGASAPLEEHLTKLGILRGKVEEQAEILMKYEGYIEKEQENVDKLERLENRQLPDTIKYAELSSLSSEAREKLDQVKPKTIGQASRISGVSPADISVLMVHISSKSKGDEATELAALLDPIKKSKKIVPRETQEKLTKCPICESEILFDFIKTKDYSVTQEPYKIVQCGGCQFKFTNPRPAKPDMGKYYDSDDYISHSNTDEGFVNRTYQLIKVYTSSKKLALVNRLSEKGKLLDIGAGTGAFLKFCGDYGWAITGIEPDESARRTAQTLHNISLYDEGLIEDIDDDSFDVITMWHVLEHVHGLKERIGEMKRILKKDGILLIAVPNCNSHDAQHYKETWAAYDVPRHLYHFTPNDIAELARQFELKVDDTKPMVFDSFYVAMLSEKYKGNTGLFGIIRACIIGFISNLKAVVKEGTHSSQIYVLSNK